MTTLKVGEKELKIKYGYEATLKTKILSKLLKMLEDMKNMDAETENSENIDKTEDSINKAENMLLFIPEFLLVGLQKYHSDEYRFDYKTNEGKEEALNKVYALLDDYFEDENADVMTLFNQLQEEMLENGFLAKMFRNEAEKAKQNTNNNQEN